MSKSKSVFACQNCGYQSAKWLGKCPDCNQWNTFAEETFNSNPKVANRYSGDTFYTLSGEATPLHEIKEQSVIRFESGNEELDRLLVQRYLPHKKPKNPNHKERWYLPSKRK